MTTAPPTADEAALLSAVREAPNDDAPRLILADCLEDSGRPDVAARIRDWVWRVKPLAVAAWGDRKRPAPDLTKTSDALQAIGPVWRLAAVLGQRLADERWPVPYSRITAWPGGWDSNRYLAAVLDCRHAAELAGYGLEAGLESAESAAESAVWAAWAARAARAARAAAWAAESALAARVEAAAAFARLYAAVLVAHGGRA